MDGCLRLFVFCVYVYMFVCMFVCMCVWFFVCVFVWMGVCVCLLLCICVFVCVYVCMFVCICERDEIIAKMKDVGGTRPFNNNYWSQFIKTVSNIIL